jgi:DNA-binding MarR family transcriptional regulator
LQERRLEEGLRTLGLTRTTWCILLGVGNEGLKRPSQIAAFVGIDRTATSRALKQMEAENLIERSNGEGDKRTTTVELTEAGRARLEQGAPFAIANNAAMSEKLTESEFADLKRLLGKLTQGERADLKRF